MVVEHGAQQAAIKGCPVALQKQAVQHPRVLRCPAGGAIGLLGASTEVCRGLSLIHNAVVDRATLSLNRDDRPIQGMPSVT